MKKLLPLLAMIPMMATPAMADLGTQFHQNASTEATLKAQCLSDRKNNKASHIWVESKALQRGEISAYMVDSQDNVYYVGSITNSNPIYLGVSTVDNLCKIFVPKNMKVGRVYTNGNYGCGLTSCGLTTTKTQWKWEKTSDGKDLLVHYHQLSDGSYHGPVIRIQYQ